MRRSASTDVHHFTRHFVPFVAHIGNFWAWTKFANGTDPTAHGQNSLIFFFIFGFNANALLHS
jgi:hypothetical protein